MLEGWDVGWLSSSTLLCLSFPHALQVTCAFPGLFNLQKGASEVWG